MGERSQRCQGLKFTDNASPVWKGASHGGHGPGKELSSVGGCGKKIPHLVQRECVRAQGGDELGIAKAGGSGSGRRERGSGWFLESLKA